MFSLALEKQCKTERLSLSSARVSVWVQPFQAHLSVTEDARSEKHCNIFFLLKTTGYLNKIVYHAELSFLHPGVNSKTIVLGKL